MCKVLLIVNFSELVFGKNKYRKMFLYDIVPVIFSRESDSTFSNVRLFVCLSVCKTPQQLKLKLKLCI